MTAPELFESVALNADGYESLPDPEAPYFVIAKEGTYLHKKTQIGNVLVKAAWDEGQKHLGRIGFAGGVFVWKGEKVPGEIISQAHDFFTRIFTTKHAEAEVLITKHNDTGCFRLFVPYQRVSHMGVKSIYDPTHVSREYTVVGTLHSHCDFTAFHSGTDSGDASDMDGVHFTIGKVNQAIPEIVAMVAMNGKEFHYTDPTEIAMVMYGIPGATAPAWWDHYVFHEGEAPAVKPRGMTSLTQQHWDEFLGRALRAPKKFQSSFTPTKWEPKSATPYRIPNQHYTGSDSWGQDWRREVYGAGKLTDLPPAVTPTDVAINDALDQAEKGGVFTDYDWADIKASDMDEIGFWRGFFTNRLSSVLDTLEILGVEYRMARITRKGRKK